MLCSEKVTDSFDRRFWDRLLLEFALERVDKRLIRQLFADAGKLLVEGLWVAAMEVCFDPIKVGIRRSCNYIAGVGESALWSLIAKNSSRSGMCVSTDTVRPTVTGWAC